MPFDKWGIPFFYPTAENAGVTGSGSGFFWQQNNNFREDEDDGFLRLGKETDQCELINSSTGEWEFPFLAEGDGLSVSGPTGHHSGGENHGCQGHAYMVDGDYSQNPPEFRFRKEMYHVNYDTDPNTGTWTSPFATQVTSSQWKGIAWVCYVKKNGVSAGVDSRVCEAWWNDDPTTDITNWHMMKRTEDKGGWGSDGDSCDGENDQIGTWSNIQFRWKSAASDFSFHPLKPEFNDGPNIHSIGGEDMSFSDSVSRGYGYRADMPNNIEMKGLFKWDAGGAGKCRFKNLSIREIDPSIAFDDPETPPAEPPIGDGGTGGGTTTVQGTFKFQQDINTLRSSPCAGIGTGGGGGGGGGGTPTGNTTFWDIPADHTTTLSDSTVNENRTRVVEICKTSSSPWNGKLVIQLDVPLKKVGTPTTPTIRAKIWNSVGTVKYTCPTEIDPATLTTSFQTFTFDFSTNTHVIVPGNRVGVEWTGTSTTDYIVCSYVNESTGLASIYANYEAGAWDEKDSRDFCCTAWE